MKRVLRVAAAIHMAREGGANLERRRHYAADWPAYVRDVFGYRLTPQQDEVLEQCRIQNRLLIPAAQNVGKSWLLGLVACALFDPVAALPGPDGTQQQGARILLPGPDAGTVFATIYSKITTHALRAATRGWRMPGEWSEKSVLWRVAGYPEWTMECLTPPKRVGERQAHGAAGRHHVNQHALVEEGIALSEALWMSIERSCSGAGNKIISAYNPTEPFGPTITRERTGTYRVVRLSALDHPNVRTRSTVVPGAVSHEEVDELVRVHTIDQGPFPGTPLDPDRGDFVYAVPSKELAERGERKDGIPGHPAAAARVRRPMAAAEVSVLGRTASAGETGLFSADAIARAVDRWRAASPPAGPPSRVGADPARTGADDSCAAPAWGEGAEALLRAYHEAQQRGPDAVRALQATRRIRIGQIEVLPKGDGKVVGEALATRFPGVPYTVDAGGVGTAPIDYLRHVLKAQVGDIDFGGRPPDPVPQQLQAENMRTHMYVLLAMLCSRDLADLPPDPALHEDLLAHSVKYRSRSVDIGDTKRNVTSVLLASKDEVKAKIGRSPDRGDAAVLSVTEPPAAMTVTTLRDPMSPARYGEPHARYGSGPGRTFGGRRR
jgi:hypothetical protein